MGTYVTDIRNFNKKVLPYLNKIRVVERINNAKYDFMITVNGEGFVSCYPFAEIKGKVVLSTSFCSKEIDNKLKELIKQ